MNRAGRIALRVSILLAITAGLSWFVRGMDFSRLGQAFASANISLLIVAALLNFVCLSAKAVAWRSLLAPRHVVSTLQLLRCEIASAAASAITPARAGEVLRVWILKRRGGVPAATTAAILVVEKLIDNIAMLVFVAPLPWLLPELPAWVTGAIALCVGVTLVVLVVLYVLAGRIDPTKPATAFRRFLAGIHLVRSPRRLGQALLALLVLWAVDLAAVTAVLRAVGVELPIAAGLFTLFTLSLTIIVPSTPAQIGTLEVGALVALELLHVPHERALAFALLYHAGQVIPTLMAGLLLEHRLVTGREQLRSEPEPSGRPP